MVIVSSPPLPLGWPRADHPNFSTLERVRGDNMAAANRPTAVIRYVLEAPAHDITLAADIIIERKSAASPHNGE
ncbi:MAG: hypothetical protein KF889_05345 [Alphaproteobacteria bacterium]|nr:hypothetical protein [Alphaproteobacteria bacterium]MCW5742294.1 hypothetical protein [Alphaproteobacteria bacterium]